MKLDIEQIIHKIEAFREARDWKQFHNPKDLALSLSLESAEVLEHFQWKNGEDLKQYISEHKNEIGDELSDVLYWVLLLANDLGIDLQKAMDKKLLQNEEKYPISKSKGLSTKYNQL